MNVKFGSDVKFENEKFGGDAKFENEKLEGLEDDEILQMLQVTLRHVLKPRFLETVERELWNDALEEQFQAVCTAVLDGKDVVDDQIKHPRRESTGFAHLEAGRHAFELHFFQSNHDSHLSLDYTLPSGTRLPVPASAFSIDADAKLRFKPDPEWSGSTP